MSPRSTCISEITRYKSAHPCWRGLDFVVLPHMGYLIYNGRVLSYYAYQDIFNEYHEAFDRRDNTLETHLTKRVLQSKEIWFKEFRKPDVDPHLSRFGMTRMLLREEYYWFFSTGGYDHETGEEKSIAFDFSRTLRDYTPFVTSCIKSIQRLARKRIWKLHSRSRLLNLRKITSFVKNARGLPQDILSCIVEEYVRDRTADSVAQGNERPPMRTIKTNLF